MFETRQHSTSQGMLRPVSLDDPRGTPSSQVETTSDQAGQLSPRLGSLFERLKPILVEQISQADAKKLAQKELIGQVSDVVIDLLDDETDPPSLSDQRRLVALSVDFVLTSDSYSTSAHKDDAVAGERQAKGPGGKPSLEEAKRRVKPLVLERIDVGAASNLDHASLVRELRSVVSEIREELRLYLTKHEQDELVTALVDDMIGLGPLEALLGDQSVTDIMVNGPSQIYIERSGKLELTDIKFQDNAHVLNVATRIVTRVGRRVDESSPICDARLADGSRVNVIIPPLAIDGPSISIRKFSKKSITLDIMARNGTMAARMAMLLKIASRSRLNILISGGTGSGKTTLLNAMSELIDHGERIVTIEDAAELQLQQPHVVRLETRPPNLEGKGEVTMRGLVKNALRMRPDRIIVGEVRGAEALDMLQAMNTGHDGSMATVHANKPRDALTRLENMVNMSGVTLPSKAVRTQIASAVDLIVQVARMRDGVRRVNCVTEVVGMEGDVVVTQDLFMFEFQGEDERGKLRGAFRPAGVRPHFFPRAEYFGLGQALLETVS